MNEEKRSNAGIKFNNKKTVKPWDWKKDLGVKEEKTSDLNNNKKRSQIKENEKPKFGIFENRPINITEKKIPIEKKNNKKNVVLKKKIESKKNQFIKIENNKINVSKSVKKKKELKKNNSFKKFCISKGKNIKKN